MFKSAKPSKSEATRARVYQTALTLFRSTGFEATTMRDVAAQARLALGGAYYYFPSKDAIVLAYYQEIQAEHGRRVRELLPGVRSLAERIALVNRVKLDILANDRKLMGALLRYAGEPDHPLSFLSQDSRSLREQGMSLFAEALAPEKLPPDLRSLLPMLLWGAHMGLLLYFLYDKSAGQQRTHRLNDNGAELMAKLLAVAKLGILKPVRGKLAALLRDAELLPA